MPRLNYIPADPLVYSPVNKGLMYNHYSAVDSRGIAPAGWHLPTDADFTQLFSFLGDMNLAGGKLKASTGWNPGSGNGTDDFGFRALPGGLRWENDTDFTNGDWVIGLWSSYINPLYPTDAGGMYIGSGWTIWPYGAKRYSGRSIRHIKDNSIDPGYMRDFDNNVYNTCTIGSQVWMSANLKVTHFNDGSVIPDITDSTAWRALSTSALCSYDNNPANV